MLSHHESRLHIQTALREEGFWMHVNSQFKISKAFAQSDYFLGSVATVLDYTQAGLITYELERKTFDWWQKVLLCVCCACEHVFSSVNISASHPSWLIISKLEEESHWRDIKASSKPIDNIFHSHFLIWGLFFKHFLTSLKNTFHNIVGIALNKQHNPQSSNVEKDGWVWNVSTQDSFRERYYLDLLVFDQSIYESDDKVFGETKVCFTNTLWAVHDECQIQRRTPTLWRRRKHAHKRFDKGSH